MNPFLRRILFLILAIGTPRLAALAAPLENPPPIEEQIEIVPIPTPLYSRYREDMRETQALLEDHDTAGLEAMAAKLRASKETLDSSTSFLHRFYETACDVSSKEPGQSRAMAFYEKWARESPESITAQICLARAYSAYAWNALPSRTNTTTDEEQKLYNDRLNKAWQILEQAKTLQEKCPGWYAAAQDVGYAQGWDRERFMELTGQAIAAEPAFGDYYPTAYLWLQWSCDDGDLEKWIAQQADSHPEAEQDRQYARLVYLADLSSLFDRLIFAPDHLDWKRVQRGFDLWLKDTPDNLIVRMEYIRLALLAGDREVARTQLQITGPKDLPFMWDECEFKEVWRYAFGEGPNPLFTPEEKSPLRTFSPKTIATVHMVSRTLSGLIGGILAGTLLLLLALQRHCIWAGVVALVMCVILAGLGGTALTVVPAAALWLYLRRRPASRSEIVRQPSGWLTLAGLAGLALLYLGLQIGAIIFIGVPLVFEQGTCNEALLLKTLIANGSIFNITIASAWISFLLLLTICRPQSTESWRRTLGLHVPRLSSALVWIVIGGAGMFLASWLMHSETVQRIIPDETTRKFMQNIFLGRESPVLFVLALVVVAPLFEELVFRGYAFSGLVHKIGTWGTIMLTSLVFAVAHMQYGLAGFLFIFTLGFILSVVRWRTGSIYPAIILHAALNLTVCLQAFGLIPS